MGVSFECHFEGVLNEEIFQNKFGINLGGRVQFAIDNSCVEWCKGYSPWRTGALANSPYTASEIGSGEIVYQGPNVRNLYYGIGITNYSKIVNPLAGSFWFERMKADHVDDILKEAISSV